MTEGIATEEPVAAPEVDGPSDEVHAPYGWMTDPTTGERRPKKRPGRRSKTYAVPGGKTPSVEELQALGALSEGSEDTAPGALPKGRARRRAMKAEAPAPPFRAGVIAKGMNGLYRKAGRILRMLDRDIGTAVIATTQAEDDDDTTVGEAWEELARTNPRIRAFLMRLMVGGAWSSLVQAHLPIVLAIAMKDGIRQRIPFMGLAEVLLTDEPEGPAAGAVPSGLAGMMGGIGPEDMAQIMDLAQQMMGQAAANVPRAQGVPRGPVNGAPWEQDAPRERPTGQE